MSEARSGVGFAVATLAVCGLGLVWQAWAIRDLRTSLADAARRIDTLETAALREKAQKTVTAADRAARFQKRHERRSDPTEPVDTLVPLGDRPADAEEWLDELAASLDRFGGDHDVPVETLDAVLRVYEDMIDANRATREHLAAGHLTHATAREQVVSIQKGTQEALQSLLGPELARLLPPYLPRDPRREGSDLPL